MRIIRLKEVTHLTGLARSTVYKYLAEGKFPKSVPLGHRSIGFLESEIQEWIMARIKERDMVG
ncbi:helix-turn-helix transcriptional regulator [Ectopseudomonas alcaliphila]|uniref:helix-turn-helix transcriptional regulator n=1 Tax=Ectopseudomonas alcaliphila TaxID=101564 RepID=UPI00117B2E35|nr:MULTISPECIES: AlpA family transcriptional regulator [Pseudomonas]MDP9937884.1 prophage regulatory protein [Pseudomonas sp. 3400]MDR7010107.1 prophage regulatory protein [Pseudomonas alcaliphila]TRO30318.1 AlpA family transcriptional regulator [Pseudomonas sp. ALS1131]